jgi:hypothetical protein
MTAPLSRFKHLVTVGLTGANALMGDGWVLLSVSQKRDGEFSFCLGSRKSLEVEPSRKKEPTYEVLEKILKRLPNKFREAGCRRYIADGLAEEEAEALTRAIYRGLCMCLRDASLEMARESERRANA